MSKTLSTIGVIARRYDVQLHRVEYVIRSRGIQPETRAGNARVFSESDVERIGKELFEIEQLRDLGALTDER